MPNFNSIGSGVSEPQVAEYRYLHWLKVSPSDENSRRLVALVFKHYHWENTELSILRLRRFYNLWYYYDLYPGVDAVKCTASTIVCSLHAGCMHPYCGPGLMQRTVTGESRLSVCRTHELWQNERKFWPHSYTTWKIVHPSFLTRRMVDGDDPFYLKFWVRLTPLERKRRFSIDNRS